INIQKGTSIEGVAKGAYIVKEEQERLDGIIIATGAEVELANLVSEELAKRGLDVRVVSMPIMSLFNKQPKKYQEELFPIGIKKVVIEAGSSYGWHQFVYNDKYLITIDEFGTSGHPDDVIKYFKFNLPNVTNRIEKILR
ncbi:MAG: transketolase C-terminal domain-containing protein, partial [Bacilli bacterium]